MSRADDARFDSWKEIATYLGRDVRTVRRWEKERSLPVHRVPGGGRRAVYAYRSEIEAWLLNAGQRPDTAVEPFSDPLQSQHSPPLESQRGTPVPNSLNDTDAEASAPSTHGPSTSGSFRALGIAGLVAVGLALLSAFFFVNAKGSHKADASPSGAPIIPSGIQHWVRISLVNGQPESVPGPFQQLLIVDSSRYSSFEAENLQNIQFFDERGRILRSWLESGNLNLSSRTAYWIQFTDGMPASKVVNIYMGFAAPNRNLLNADMTGEAPGLSSSYGEFDNGSRIFSRYANFAGTWLPQGWYSSKTPEGQGGVRVNNGVYLWHKGRGGGSTFLGSDWNVGGNIAEMGLQTAQTVRGQDMIFVCSSSPTSFRWTPASIGYQDMSGLEIENNDAGAPSVLAVANPNPMQSAVIGFQDGTLFANYQPVASVRARICGGNYLASSVNTGYSASFSFDWVRMRVPPPHGVMPVTIFGELK